MPEGPERRDSRDCVQLAGLPLLRERGGQGALATERGICREIQKHIEDLRIAPAPEAGDRVVRTTGRAKIDGLLGAEEAVRLQLVAGGLNHRNRAA